MTDLVSARAAHDDEAPVTSALAEQEQVTVRSERGGRWHLDHDAATDSPLNLHQQSVDRDDQVLVVGCIDDVVVGFARAGLSPTRTGQLCMIDELIVRPEARAIGVGSSILEFVEAWAREHQCEAIESQVLPGNRAAKNFFERVGMKTRKMRVSADLS